MHMSVAGHAPPLPVLPPTFQATLEINMVNKARTIIATEYYDGLGNRAAIRMKQNHTENYILMDYNNDQILYVSESNLNSLSLSVLYVARNQSSNITLRIYCSDSYQQ